jgi:LPXTG-motif cell wall-anchored protein
LQRHLRFAVVTAGVCVAAVLFSVSPASAHTMVVVCDTATGELVWTNADAIDGDTTVVTSTGVTIDVPAGESVRTAYIGPGTWVATWGDGVTVEGEMPAACVDTTTTTPPPTTVPTTPPDETFVFSVSSVCINDAPYLRYSASIPGFAAGTPMVLHWLDESGAERYTQSVTLGDGQVVWPGAEVAEQGGEPIDWPGWVTLPNGEWVQADDGFVWARGTVGVFATVNPTSPVASTSYPLPSPDCRVNPPGQTSIASLPSTGTSQVAPAVLTGALLMLAGACFMVVTRARSGERPS